MPLLPPFLSFESLYWRLAALVRPDHRRVGMNGPSWMAILGAIAALLASGCSRKEGAISATGGQSAPQARVAEAAIPLNQPRHRSTECRDCHREIFASWAGSHHARAHRPVNAVADADALQPERTGQLHGVDYAAGWKEGKPLFVEKRSGFPDDRYTAEYVLGFTPLRQYIVPAGNGRYQAAELAYDHIKNEWFNVFGDEKRQPGEWGHWRGRGMNWNSMCAHCHMTAFDKKYDSATDSYASTWVEHGVGCVQCHGPIRDEHLLKGYKTAHTGIRPLHLDNKRMMETCAPCHARNELLTGVLVPGAAYADQYRLTLPVERGVWHPDGQQLDEDFNYTSLVTSRMGGKAGVTCLDCHDGHTMKTKLPASNNAICMQCHAAPGRMNAPVIDPTGHSKHKDDSKGNLCVECHMPTNTYMQRDPRHDHGFLKPDPLLTKELGIPNACTKCHADKNTDWEIEWVDKWYGAKMESRQRQRARVVAAAQNNVPGAIDKLLPLIPTEDIPAWRASLLLIGRNAAGADPRLLQAASANLGDPDPLVRSAAVQVLGASPEHRPLLRPLLKDPTRLVRLDAAWALSSELAEGSVEREELDAYLRTGLDQPSGQMRLGQDLFNRGRAAAAEAPLRKAVAWDPNSAGFHETLGFVLDSLNKPGEAGSSLMRAAALNGRDPMSPYYAALAFAQAGRLEDAESALREAVKREPRLDRAWYNLGLLLHQTKRSAEGIEALKKAEAISPQSPDYPYARATILHQQGDREGAAAAARRALEINPNYAPARALLGAP